jgi:hypothetical protein
MVQPVCRSCHLKRTEFVNVACLDTLTVDHSAQQQREATSPDIAP